MTQPRIALYGATGFTGGLVARELADKVDSFIVSGRNHSKLDRLAAELRRDTGAAIETRWAHLDAPDSLDEMLDGVGALINCAGPFTDVGAPVVEAAVRNGVHYFDTTGEQAYMKWVQSEYAYEADEKGIVLVPGCAYEYATGNFAARIATTMGARRLAICYAARDMGMSHGTKKSVVRALSDRGYTYVDSHLEARRPGYRFFDVPLPGARSVRGAWFPGGESLTVPLFAKVTQVETCLAVGDTAARLLQVASPLLGGVGARIIDRASPLVDRIIDLTSGDPHAQGKRPSFVVVAFDPDNAHFYAGVAGTDPYDTTARIIVEAARRVLAEPPEQGGFTSPPALFDTRDFMGAVGLDVIES